MYYKHELSRTTNTGILFKCFNIWYMDIMVIYLYFSCITVMGIGDGGVVELSCHHNANNLNCHKKTFNFLQASSVS